MHHQAGASGTHATPDDMGEVRGTAQSVVGAEHSGAGRRGEGSGRQRGATLAAPGRQDRAACAGPHAQTEAVGAATTPVAGLEGALAHWKLPLTDTDTPRSRAPRRNEGGAAMNSDCPTVVKARSRVKLAAGHRSPIRRMSTRHAEVVKIVAPMGCVERDPPVTSGLDAACEPYPSGFHRGFPQAATASYSVRPLWVSTACGLSCGQHEPRAVKRICCRCGAGTGPGRSRGKWSMC